MRLGPPAIDPRLRDDRRLGPDRRQPPAGTLPRRPAWVEIDLAQLSRNWDLINQAKPPALRVLAVVKDEAYGHGALAAARVALAHGAVMLATATLDEALALRAGGIRAPLLLFGARPEAELPWCLEYDLACCVGDLVTARRLAELATARGKRAVVHLEFDTGMSRYGVRWTAAAPLLAQLASLPTLELAGVMTHFAMSDEADKTFAREQLARFNQALAAWPGAPASPPLRHLCNSGGFLDLPEAHGDMVRLGILPLGVYPSAVCRRLPGLAPAMSVHAAVAIVRELLPGDTVGYGMRYQATTRRRLAVLPLGYADGFPRVRNQGYVLIAGRRAPILGGVAMDAMMVDVTEAPEVRPGDEAVLLGRQADEEITAHDVARWKGTVSYEVMTAWRARLPRVYRNAEPATPPLPPPPPQP